MPLSLYDINYEMMLTSLEKTDGIVYNGSYHTGNPKVFAFHLDISFIPSLTLGVNRVFQFGGGPRREDTKGLVKTFFKPGDYDNTNKNLTSNDEYGNQITTITLESKFQNDVPFKVYAEIGAEDTAGDSINKWDSLKLHNYIKFPTFGNSATIMGVYFPFITNDISKV